jgi:glycine oxidase
MPDAVVIGGGVMGLAAAHALRQRGYGVTLLEQGELARAASWASAGIFGASTSHAGAAGQPLRDLSQQLWPDFARAIADESGMDPEYRETGVLTVALDDSQAAELAERVQAGHARGGRLVESRELRELEPSLGPAVQRALWQPGGNVDNRRLCRALELSIRAAGVTIRTAARVVGVAQQGGRVAGVRLSDATIPADLVVLAAGAWSGGIAGVTPVPTIVPQRGQVIALDRGNVLVRQVVMTLTDPYLVPRADGRLIVGATREFAGWDARLTAGGAAWLLNEAIRLMPALAQCAIQDQWTGFRPLSQDGQPLIGPGQPAGLYFLTGHGPSGIAPLPGSIALLLALIEGTPPPVAAEPFSPTRFPAAATQPA